MTSLQGAGRAMVQIGLYCGAKPCIQVMPPKIGGPSRMLRNLPLTLEHRQEDSQQALTSLLH